MSEKTKGQAKHEAWGHSEEIAHLYTQEFKSAQQIANIYGCNQAVIVKILRSVGVSIPSDQ